MDLLDLVFQPGFFASESVRTALAIGGGAALVSGVIGVFTIIRGQSFAGHALADISSAGGSASYLLGVNPLFGFMAMALAAAAGMEVSPIRRTRERDLVTGIVLGAGLGLSALFLYLAVTVTSTTGAAITVMFGSMFAISPAIVPLAIAVGAGALVVVAIIYRPLLLSCLDSELAAVRGVNVRLIGMIHVAVLALATSLSAMTVGAVLATALLIGPAATTLRLTDRPGLAILLSPLLGLVVTWGGILLAYNSYYWTPGHGWPVSFFIVTLIVVLHFAVIAIARLREPKRLEPPQQATPGRNVG